MKNILIVVFLLFINKISAQSSAIDVKNNEVNSVKVKQSAIDAIIDKQVVAFNARDLNAFVLCFSKEIVVKNFPDDTLYVGRSKIKKSYRSFFANNHDVKVEVKNRIALGHTVINKEVATKSGRTKEQVAIYEIENNKISSMTFIHQKKTVDAVEAIVQNQLNAYNSRNINAFLEPYSKEIAVFDFPHKLLYKGHERMRAGYTRFFESTPNLYCDLKNRILIGSTVIDHEFVTANSENFSAIAIYEIINGKIKEVTFIR